MVLSEEFDEGTWILTRATNSHFSWDQGKYERHFNHGQKLLPELMALPRDIIFQLFCNTRVRQYLNDIPSVMHFLLFSQSNLDLKIRISLIESHLILKTYQSTRERNPTYWYVPTNLHKYQVPF